MSIEFKTTIGQASDPEIPVDCIKCSQRTSHSVLAKVEETGSTGSRDEQFHWHIEYQLIQCLGCKSISYQTVRTNSEDFYHDEDGEIIHDETVDLYPPRKVGEKRLSDELFYLPFTVRQIYEETLIALSVNAPLLATIGLRALIESVCKEKHAKGNNLHEKIDSLVEMQCLTPTNAKILHKIRSIGNAAAHEAKLLSNKQLNLALDIVEHLLKDVYILPKKSENEFGKD